MSKPLLQHDLQYLASGKSVFPVIITADGKKRPLVKWKRFQTKLPTQDEVKSWWQRWPDACIGLICGFVSGVSVIDVAVLRENPSLLDHVHKPCIAATTISLSPYPSTN